MPSKPATILKNDLKSWLDAAKEGQTSATIPLDNIRAWYKLADKINASMRLDGSALSKRKKAPK